MNQQNSNNNFHCYAIYPGNPELGIPVFIESQIQGIFIFQVHSR